jgi:hypothetical protein
MAGHSRDSSPITKAIPNYKSENILEVHFMLAETYNLIRTP